MPYMKEAYDVGYLLPLALFIHFNCGQNVRRFERMTLVMIMFKLNVLNYLTDKI